MTTAIILAGGLGTRLRSIVSNVPKPMASVQGRPFLEWLMGYYHRQGVTHFILSVGHLAYVIQRYFGYKWHGCTIEYSLEAKPLGTGGGILQASKLLASEVEACLVINGDTFFAIDLDKLIAFHQIKGAAITFATFISTDIERYMSMSVDTNKKIKKLNVQSKSGACLVNGGAYLINRSLLNSLINEPITPQSWENETLPKLLGQKVPLYAYAIDADFIDIGVPSDYQRAQQFDFKIS